MKSVKADIKTSLTERVLQDRMPCTRVLELLASPSSRISAWRLVWA